jgi:hypothetical protein
MHIYERGAILRNSKDNTEMKIAVLVADIFELNTDLKAMIVVDVDSFNYEFTNDSEAVAYMKAISECDIFKCEATAMGHNFSCVFDDCTIEADYANGSIVRFYLEVEDYDSHVIKVDPKSNNDKMKEILDDKSILDVDLNNLSKQE